MSGDDLNTRLAEKRIGRVLRGKWRIDRLIGVGGMAAVYAGTHRNGKRGAIKVLHAEYAADELVRERFLREGYVANRVEHPGVVAVIDDDTDDDGTTFLVMELLEGAALDERAEKGLSIGEVLKAMHELLDVLASAHAKGIVHRDIKPENLFLTSAGPLKVLDFGIARVREAGNTARGTRTGEAMGTPAFMPPEQALGEWDKVDGQSDVWSVGATLFTLLSGRLVHDEPTVQKLMLAAMTKQAPSLGTIRPDLPRPVIALVDRALRFEKSERFPDARAMQEALRLSSSTVAHPAERLPGSGGAAGTKPIARPIEIASATESTSAFSTDRRTSPIRRRALVVGIAAGAATALAAAALFLARARPPSADGGDVGAPVLAATSGPIDVVTAQAESPPPASASASAAPSAAPSASAAASAAASAEPTVAPAADATSPRRGPRGPARPKATPTATAAPRDPLDKW